MKHEIKRICPASLGKILAAIYFIIGCILSIIALGLPLSGIGLSFQITGPINFGSPQGTSVGYILAYPIIAAVASMAFGFLTAWLYNGISRVIGGIEITIDEKNGA
jgi:hypothetical protein